MPQHITVVDYDPCWPSKFIKEREAIKKVLEDHYVSIYPIGSTAVSNLAAKPIIDIMVVVENLDDVDKAADKFEKIGYEYLGEFGIAGRMKFSVTTSQKRSSSLKH